MTELTELVDVLRLSLDELLSLPTLVESQTCNLKAEGNGWRVWLSRCGVADGEPYPNKVTIERRDGDGHWFDALYYQAHSTGVLTDD